MSRMKVIHWYYGFFFFFLIPIDFLSLRMNCTDLNIFQNCGQAFLFLSFPPCTTKWSQFKTKHDNHLCLISAPFPSKIHLIKSWKRRLWNTCTGHILYSHWNAIGQGEKGKHANPKHAALKNSIKSRNGWMSSFLEPPSIIFLFCQLNSQDTEVTEGEGTKNRSLFNCLAKSNIQSTFTLGLLWR